MFVLEYKVKPKPHQIEAIHQAIRTTQFVRHQVLRYWMENLGSGKTELFQYNTALRKEFKFVEALKAHACQTAVERTLRAITQFDENCRNQVVGNKGYPPFKKHSRLVEYKVSGWKRSEEKRPIAFTDKKGNGQLKLIGSRDIHSDRPKQIKRVRILKCANGDYVQFCIKLDLRDTVQPSTPSGKTTGIDVGLKFFLVDSKGHQIDGPQYYRKAKKHLNRLSRRKSKKCRQGQRVQKTPVSRHFEVGSKFRPVCFRGRLENAPDSRQKQSQNYHKARKRFAKKHLRVSRQQEEFVRESVFEATSKTLLTPVKSVALRLVKSNDLIAYEDLNVKSPVKNRHLAKSITDAKWSIFRQWFEDLGRKYDKLTIAVSFQNTSVNCSNYRQKVQKSLSARTHACPPYGYTDCRDRSAALNILQKGLSSVGRTQTLKASGEIPSEWVGEIRLI